MDRPLLKMILKCCVCGRVRDGEEWNYRFEQTKGDELVSHGFCEECYENEMGKLKWESQCAAAALYR